MYFWFIRKHTPNPFDFNWPNLYFYIDISVQFSSSAMSGSLWPHNLQHARPPCPSPSPRTYSNSWPCVSDAIQLSHPLPSPSPPLRFLPEGWYHVYLRLLVFFPAILIPACSSSNPAFCIMYSAYKLSKQSDNIQPWRTSFLIWHQTVVLCPVLTVASWPAYRFLKRQVGGLVFPSLSEFPTVYCDPHSQRIWYSQLSRSKCFFLKLSCFFDDSADVGNLISGSSAFSKTSLNFWKFTVHILLNLAWKIWDITLLACEMSAILW